MTKEELIKSFRGSEKAKAIEYLLANKEEMRNKGIFINENADNGTVFAFGTARVEAHGDAEVFARDNASVFAFDTAKVVAYDTAEVSAHGNAKVVAHDNSYIYSYYLKECKLKDNAIYRVIVTNTIYYSNDEIKFEKQ